MKKKIILIIIIVIAIILLVPIPMRLKDGGSIRFQALLYNITKYHKLDVSTKDGYVDGIRIEILGVEVFNNIESPETITETAERRKVKDVKIVNSKNINTNELVKFNGIVYGKSNSMIDYAGNLNKALFLYKKFSNKKIYVYGPNKTSNFNFANYKGQYSPEDIPLHINEGWGLVWDGKSVTTLEGKMGNYLKFITPHKLSMYIRSGIPVIVWKQAAVYNFVKKNNIGIGIDKLTDVDDELANISSEQYAQMRKSVLQLAEKLDEGYFTKKAIEVIEKYYTRETTKEK